MSTDGVVPEVGHAGVHGGAAGGGAEGGAGAEGWVGAPGSGGGAETDVPVEPPPAAVLPHERQLPQCRWVLSREGSLAVRGFDQKVLGLIPSVLSTCRPSNNPIIIHPIILIPSRPF